MLIGCLSVTSSSAIKQRMHAGRRINRKRAKTKDGDDVAAIAVSKANPFDDLETLLFRNFEHLSRGELRRLADVAEERAGLFEKFQWGALEGCDQLWPATMSSIWKTLAAGLRSAAAETETNK